MPYTRKTKLISIVLAMLLSLILILQNTETVNTRILFFTVSMPRSLLLLSVCLLGFIAGSILTLAFSKPKK